MSAEDLLSREYDDPEWYLAQEGAHDDYEPNERDPREGLRNRYQDAYDRLRALADPWYQDYLSRRVGRAA